MRISDWSSDVCSSDLGGVSVRCAGALCRGSAGCQPDHLRGGRSAISAAYRNKGGMRMEALERELVGLAFCWRLDRRDGVSMGLTSHARDLMVDGLIYRASPGMLPSEIGRASCRDRVCPYVLIAVVGASLKKK